ncbi:MAG: hypothetical protein DRI34_09525 [Deltaproteobacteria bacterium]|nr:MAG: hypothetical protein DRI34_09525 [Deltaproteobacteria bacterium]
MNAPEQRLSARHHLEAEFELADGISGGEIFFESRDLSGGGVFLKSDLLLEVGEIFWISFRLPGTEVAIRTRGKVVRVNREADGSDPRQQAGMGIQFLDLNEAERAALEAYLQED